MKLLWTGPVLSLLAQSVEPDTLNLWIEVKTENEFIDMGLLVYYFPK